MFPTCYECKFWLKPTQEKLYANFSTDMGQCTNPKLLYGRDRERIVFDTQDVVMPDLFTGCSFSCCHFEAKK